jgi:proline dehydrogenase
VTDVLRDALLSVAAGDTVKRVVTRLPVTAGVVRRFVAGETVSEVIKAVRGLRADGLSATVDYLGEHTTDEDEATANTAAYVDLLAAFADAGFGTDVEVSIKLSALGQALGSAGHGLALGNARQVVQAARRAGTTVTVDMEDHTTTDSTLEIVAELRRDHPDVGAVLQSQLRRTEADCRDLNAAGSRVRLCKGAYAEPANVAFASRREVDRAYVRCMKVLLGGDGYPMLATHDPRLIAIAGALADRYDRRPDSMEYQMLFGVRPDEQRRLARAGNRVRVYVPFGDAWYGYLMRRMAEKPANAALFLRSLTTKK